MAITTVVDLTGTQPLALVDALLAPTSGIQVVAGSISLVASGPGAVNLYDAVTGAGLGIGAGLLLTSGATPGSSNTLTWYGSDNSGSTGFENGDADINAVVNTVFQTQAYDATTLKFDFTVSDPAATSVSFDLVFGSEEYPEWVDAFVDCAVVIVDGVNYALFNKDSRAPLSVISPNLAAGYFQDNAAGTIPIEYDGVSGRLRIVAPLDRNRSVHTIKIGIADTGDHILDSGLFVSGLSAGTDPGSGVVSDPGGGSSGNDTCNGSSKDEYFNLLAGDDTVYAGAGNDIVVAGSGNDKVYGGSGDDELKGDQDNDLLDGGADVDTAVYAGASSGYQISYDAGSDQYTINGTATGEGSDTLVNIEQLRFSDGLFSLSPGGLGAITATPGQVNSAGTVVITDVFGSTLSGPAGPDVTLIASVSDSDGLSGLITYQWLRDGQALTTETGDSHVVQEADLGHFLSVSVTYSDDQGHQENHTSQSLLALPANGDLLLSLMSIEGPASANVYTPITTLLLRAVELGETPNTAIQNIRFALNVPAAVGSLLSTNAYKILQGGNDANALALAKLEAQVAILCSCSQDQSGSQLTQALLDRAANSQVFDLASPTDLATLPWLSTDQISLIAQRNGHINKAVALLGSGDSIENEWKDFISNWDLFLTDLPLSILSHAINQAPQGNPSASLPHLAAGQQPFSLSTAQLTQGVKDPDGDTLTVQGLSTDHGDWFIADTATGDWSLDVTANGYDPDYFGPLELSYGIDDGHGHLINVQQLLVVDHANHLPQGEVTLQVAGGGALAQYATLTANDTLVDADGIPGPIDYGWYAGSTLIGSGSQLLLTQALVGLSLHVQASYVDGFGKAETVSSATSAPVANVDDPASGSLGVSGTAVEGGSLTAALTSLSDPDGAISAVAYRWELLNGQTWTPIAGQNAASFAIPTGQGYGGQQVRVVATSTDVLGGSTSFVGSAQTIIPADTVAPTLTDISVQGLVVSLAFSEAISGNGLPPTSAFTVQTVSGTTVTARTLTSVTLDSTDPEHRRLLLTLSGTAPTASVDLRVSYSDPSGNQSGGVVQDLAGNDLASLSNRYAGTYSSASSVTSLAGQYLSLILTGSSAINGSGNAANNTIRGNEAANTLNGGAGSDSLIGGGGNDTYVVDSSSDSILELDGGGSDLVQSSVTFSLAGLDAVENLTLTGSNTINGSGNGLANSLLGNGAANLLQGGSGADSLNGGSGNDTLSGGLGSDSLTGGSGADVFRFDTALETNAGTAVVDTITDFSKSQSDRLELSSQVFTALTGSAVVNGVLASSAFLASSTGTATTTAQRILYNSGSGLLSYDSDGSGSTAALAFAKLSTGLALTSAQFLVANLPLGL